MTNQFLMSLAVADLLVSMVVMPFGAMVIFRGRHHMQGIEQYCSILFSLIQYDEI